MSTDKYYSDGQIAAVLAWRESGLAWDEVAKKFNKKYGQDISAEAARHIYRKYFTAFDFGDGKNKIEMLKKVARTHRSKTSVAKENRIILDYLNEHEDILDGIERLVKRINTTPLKVATPKSDTSKPRMLIEGLISDVHYGLKTKSFSTAIARKRMQKWANTFVDEYRRYSVNYNVSNLQLLLNGDIIQSATMHPDSAASCDSSNAEQLATATESLFFDVVLPIAALGVPLRIVVTPGNHDRFEPHRLTANPGRNYLTYTIYRSLEMLCKQTGLKHVTFVVPDEAFCVYDVFGKFFLVEHGDNVKANTPDALERQIARRSAQVGKTLCGIRIGHYHCATAIERGRFIVNGSVTSDDHYAASLGFYNSPTQAINYYVETSKRTSPYYHTFFPDLTV